MSYSLADLEAAVRVSTSDTGWQWLQAARQRVLAEVSVIRSVFPAVGRYVGQGPLRAPGSHPGNGVPSPGSREWNVAEGARVLLLAAVGPSIRAELSELFRYGDADERRAVLRALPIVAGDEGVALVEESIRTNDARLVAAALSPYALERLSERALAQAVLKCVFMGVPLADIEGLAERRSPEMSRMLAGYVHERVAAGRSVPAEVWRVIDAYPPSDELAAIARELEHPLEDRRRAAAAALAQRTETNLADL